MGFAALNPSYALLRGALDESTNRKGPTLINVRISQGSARKLQEFRRHS
jgi:hypothetical protein